MGTRELKVVRFRKHYYFLYHQYDHYPDGLGKLIAAEILTDAANYQQWLAAQRKSAEEWEAVKNLVVEHPFQSSELSKTLGDLTVSDTASPVHQIVVPKDFRDIPWRQRHGPFLRRFMFYLWSHVTEDLLAATLAQLNPENLLFREIAYAALSLAAGGKNVKVVSSEDVSSNGVFGFIHEKPEYTADSEFISVLASGSHLQNTPPGSSPEATIYWLDDVLVVLTAQLSRPGAADERIAHVVRYCQKNHPSDCVDAVLISVEHVVLIHVTPGRMVQHTAVMPLFNIENHLTMTVNDRYAKPYLEKLAAKGEKFMKKEAKKQRKATQERTLKNEGANLSYGDDDDDEGDSDSEEESTLCVTQVEGNVNSTFYALVHLFEAAACKSMPLARVADGFLPNEIYTEIIKHVTDMETRESMMKVSRTFRRICQEDLLFAEGLIFEPSDACRGCDEAGLAPNSFKKYDVAAGTQSKVEWKRAGGFLDSGGASWKVAIGKEYSRKSLLAEVAFRFAEI